MTDPASPSTRRITRMEVQKKDTSRASVYVDGAFAFGVHQDLILKYGLHAGRALTIEEQQRVERDDLSMKARAAAFDYVAHKPRTEEELRRRLQQRDHHAEAIEAAVARLQELGYLDDASYADEYVRARFASKGYGPVRLRRELRQRGVAPVLIDRALEAHLDPEGRLEAARDHGRKKWDRTEGEEPRRRKLKTFAYLQRRGFTSDTIRQVLDELARVS